MDEVWFLSELAFPLPLAREGRGFEPKCLRDGPFVLQHGRT